MGGVSSTNNQTTSGSSAPTTFGGPTGLLGSIITPIVQQAVANQQPSNQSPNITTPSSSQPTTYTPQYDNFGGTSHSSSGLAEIFSSLFNSGALQRAVTNPYMPQGVNNPINVPYGLQQQSMFNIGNINPYGGTYGQGWNPYGNYYQGYNRWSQPDGNNAPTTNSNIAPPPNTTGPDALTQLNFMARNNNPYV